MWFKNLQLFRLTGEFSLDAEQLAAKLDDKRFQPCGKTEPSRIGWTSPFGDKHEQLVHSARGCLLIALKKEERVLPAAVLREQVEEKVAEIEAREARKVYGKEKNSIKDEVILDCLPRAFTRSNRTLAYIDPQSGWLIVDAASSKKAEELCSTLRESLGSLPLALPQSAEVPNLIMSQWLAGTPLPEQLEMGDECELRGLGDEAGVIRVKGEDLSSDDIRQHLNSNKRVHKLALHWDEALSFIVNDDLSLKRLKFSEQLLAEAKDQSDVEAEAQLDADFNLMSLTLARLLKVYLGWFGGERAAPV